MRLLVPTIVASVTLGIAVVAEAGAQSSSPTPSGRGAQGYAEVVQPYKAPRPLLRSRRAEPRAAQRRDRSGADPAFDRRSKLGEPNRRITRPAARGAWVARIMKPVVARREPAGRRSAGTVRPWAPWAGGVQQLLVLRARRIDRRLWLRVQMPSGPNESAGWIPADATRQLYTRIRLRIDLSRRLVQVFQSKRAHGNVRPGAVPFRGKREIRRFRSVVGAPHWPTPTGLFAIREEVRQPDPNGFLGPWVLHLTAYSEVLDRYDGGAGNIGIHGRGGSSLLTPLGAAGSHGCIRIDSDVIRWLRRVVVPGTPVRITR